MIDISSEELITLSQAAQHCPPRRHGKRPHPQTLLRWAKHGIDGIQLEVLLCGNTTCTSLPALQRFFVRLAEAANLHAARQAPPAASNANVDARLDELGL